MKLWRLIVLCLVLLLVGCVAGGCIETKAKLGAATLDTRRVLADTDVESLKANPDGSFEMTGYRTELSKALDVASKALDLAKGALVKP